MVNATTNHKISLAGNTISVCGVKKVESVTEKQAVLVTEGKLVIKGNQISVSKLDLDAGTIVLTFASLENLSFGADRVKIIKGLLK